MKKKTDVNQVAVAKGFGEAAQEVGFRITKTGQTKHSTYAVGAFADGHTASFPMRGSFDQCRQRFAEHLNR